VRTKRRSPVGWAILVVVGSVLLLVAGLQWYSQAHGQVQVGAVVTTTTLPPELQGSSTIPTPATSGSSTIRTTAASGSSSIRTTSASGSSSIRTTAASSSSTIPTTATSAASTRPMSASRVSPSALSVSGTRSNSLAARPMSSKAVGTGKATLTVTANATQPVRTSCVPAVIDIPFGSSNHPQGVSVNLIPHPLNRDSSLWVPGPDTNVAGWTDKAGWAQDNVRPGTGAGTVITIAHINYNGEEGAYSDLGEYMNSDIGKTFTVTCESGRALTYRISGGLLADKGELAADWGLPGQPLHHKLFDQQAVYGSPGEPSERFLLMSCGGLLDQAAHSYESNIFVYGVRVK